MIDLCLIASDYGVATFASGLGNGLRNCGVMARQIGQPAEKPIRARE